MGKALGIDYGTKRTGIAITDAMQIIATGLTTVATHTLDDFIADIVLKEDIDCFVVGDPKNLDGTNTDSTAHVSGFVKRLQKLYPTTLVHQIDERFTSKIAKQSILASGVKKKSRQNKALVDKVSATIILQNYLYETTAHFASLLALIFYLYRYNHLAFHNIKLNFIPIILASSNHSQTHSPDPPHQSTTIR